MYFAVVPLEEAPIICQSSMDTGGKGNPYYAAQLSNGKHACYLICKLISGYFRCFKETLL